MRLFYTEGSAAVLDAIQEAGAKLFLDLKLHDIPKTVGDATAALARFRPDLLTVHASGGAAMVAAAVNAAATFNCRVVAVTILTSMDAQDLEPFGPSRGLSEIAQRLAVASMKAGAAGLVCSGHEAAALRKVCPDAFLVTPGIRPAGTAVGDQKRVMTPERAIAAGATLLVVGRPVHSAEAPLAAFLSICTS
jgi:orotidine-5'-phosphate decarboxylase